MIVISRSARFLPSTFLLLSGFSGLVYQVSWVRLLALSVSSTSVAVSTVVASFFLGLAAGNYYAGALLRSPKQNLRTYAALEIVIGLAGLALLPTLLSLDRALALVPTLGQGLFPRFLLAFLLLLLPTFSMGVTFPILSSIFITENSGIHRLFGHFYGATTIGGALGSLFAGFILIPSVGIDGTVYLASCINFILAVCALSVSLRSELSDPLGVPGSDRTSERPLPSHGQLALSVIAFTGLTSIVAEIGFTKYLSIFTGTTVAAFSAILCVFLLGEAAGAFCTRFFSAPLQQLQRRLSFYLLALTAAILAAYASLAALPRINLFLHNSYPAGQSLHNLQYVIVLVVLFPSAFLYGMIFPLALTLYCPVVERIRTDLGRAYALNTLAGIGGALIAGLWIIPEHGTVVLLSMTAVLTALFCFVVVRPKVTLAMPMRLSALALGVTILVVPGPSLDRLIWSVQTCYSEGTIEEANSTLLFSKEGTTGVVSLIEHGSKVFVVNNGLNESSVDLVDARNGPLIETLLGVLPYLLVPTPNTALVIGLGGTTAPALLDTSLQTVHVVEIEPVVIEALQSLFSGRESFLTNDKLLLTINDARNTLLLDQTHYDIIVSQPSHPWLAGRGSLFTVEFFEIMRARLGEEGICGQWINLFNIDLTALKSILKAFFTVFRYGFALSDPHSDDLLLFGSQDRMLFVYDRMLDRMNEAGIRHRMNRHDIHRPGHLLSYFLLSREKVLIFAGNAQANTDLDILSEVHPRWRQERLRDRMADLMMHGGGRLDLLEYLSPLDTNKFLYELGR